MKIQSPFFISARLFPAIKMHGCTISLSKCAGRNSENRDVYRYFLDFDNGKHYTRADMCSGVGGGATMQQMFSTLLSFLGACGESSNPRNGRIGENASLFPKYIGEWCYLYEDELSSLQSELDATPGLIEE